MQETYRTVMAVLALFYGNNEIILQQSDTTHYREDSFSSFEIVAGLEADIFESGDAKMNETSYVDDVFVHPTALASMLGCTEQTARSRLKELETHGLVEKHGDVIIGEDHFHLYRPVPDNPREFIAGVDELAGTTPATIDDGLTEVTPSDFEHVDEGVWRYKNDHNVVVDVSNPDDSSIQNSIETQLREAGLTPSSMRNFQYQLRSKAGLI